MSTCSRYEKPPTNVDEAESKLIDFVLSHSFCYLCDTEYTDGSIRQTPVCIFVRNELELDKIKLRNKQFTKLLDLLCFEFETNFKFAFKKNGDISLVLKNGEPITDEGWYSYDRIARQVGYLKGWREREYFFTMQPDTDSSLDYMRREAVRTISFYKLSLVKERIEKVKLKIAHADPTESSSLIGVLQNLYRIYHTLITSINIEKKVMNKNNDEPIAMVFKTFDYDKFKLISENREPDHVKALINSFESRLVPNAILCNEKYEIIDGQNRFLALKELGQPILYYCIDGLDIYDVASLNSYGKNWSNDDYVRMWAALGKDEYKRILDFCKEFPDFTLANALTILSNGKQRKYVNKVSFDCSVKGESRPKSANKTSDLKLGNYTIEDIEHSRYVARCILEYKAFSSPGKQIYIQAAFISAMVMLLRGKTFDNNEMVKKVTMFPSLFHRCINSKEYIFMLEEIWNYRRQKKVRFEY